MKKETLDLIRDCKEVFKSKAGKSLLKHLLAISHYCTTTYSVNDALTMAFREGRRSIVLDVLKLLEMEELDIHGLIKQLKGESKNNVGQ
jgi:hypothetical protein